VVKTQILKAEILQLTSISTFVIAPAPPSFLKKPTKTDAHSMHNKYVNRQNMRLTRKKSDS
jgi:hypothetical protein